MEQDKMTFEMIVTVVAKVGEMRGYPTIQSLPDENRAMILLTNAVGNALNWQDGIEESNVRIRRVDAERVGADTNLPELPEGGPEPSGPETLG